MQHHLGKKVNAFLFILFGKIYVKFKKGASLSCPMANITLQGQILTYRPSRDAPVVQPFKPVEVDGTLIGLVHIIYEETQRDELLKPVSGTFHVKIDLTETGAVNHKLFRPGTAWEDITEVEMRTICERIDADRYTPKGGTYNCRYSHKIYFFEATPPTIVGRGVITLNND